MADAATAKTAKKNGKLNLHDVGKLEEIRDLGFRVDNNDGVFSAIRGIEGEDEFEFIGPCNSVSALITKVKLEAKPPVFTEKGNDLDEDPEELGHTSTGQAYIPGTGPIVHKDLADAIQERHRIVLDRIALQQKEKECTDTVLALMHKYEEDLATDDDGIRYYRAGDVVAELMVSEKEKLKTRNADDE